VFHSPKIIEFLTTIVCSLFMYSVLSQLVPLILMPQISLGPSVIVCSYVVMGSICLKDNDRGIIIRSADLQTRAVIKLGQAASTSKRIIPLCALFQWEFPLSRGKTNYVSNVYSDLFSSNSNISIHCA